MADWGRRGRERAVAGHVLLLTMLPFLRRPTGHFDDLDVVAAGDAPLVHHDPGARGISGKRLGVPQWTACGSPP